MSSEREIAEGVLGWLENPGAADVILDCVLLTGWAFSRRDRIVELVAVIGSHRETVPYGLKRADVREAYPHEPHAEASGFYAFLSLSIPFARRAAIEVWATLEDRRELRLFVRPVRSRASTALIEGARRLRPKAWSPDTNDARVPDERHQDPTQHASRRATLRQELASFLARPQSIDVPSQQEPRVSVIIVTWNGAERSLICLRSVEASTVLPFELVVVDNGSTDDTAALLDRVRGATIIRNGTNRGFAAAANQGAAAARGEYLVFVNNDAELATGSLDRLVDTFASRPDIGAVGGKLIHDDGQLQEAGAIIWADGSCEAFGRGGDPDSSEVNLQRDVDYCSAALLMTGRALFNHLGRFDEGYGPAYYEDSDYCVRIWKAGHRVVYQPAAVAVHLEFAGSPSPGAALKLQLRQRTRFVSLHRDWLLRQPVKRDGLSVARAHRRERRAVLVVDDAWPDPAQGAGFPRAAALLRALIDLECQVALWPSRGAFPREARYGPLGQVEVLDNSRYASIRDYLESVQGLDAVIVSRPHNMQRLKAAIGSDLSRMPAPVIYDAEAVYAARELARRQVLGSPLSPSDASDLILREVRLADGCALVLAVSDAEGQRFTDVGHGTVKVLRHSLTTTPTEAAFESRGGVLFVGALSADSPNEDAVLFLVREVLPFLREQTTTSIPLTIAGANISQRIRALAGTDVEIVADSPDLRTRYGTARVFVAPSRYSAGIPLKVYEAAAHGVPVVCTSQLAAQLDWQANVEVLTGDSAREIAAAIARVHTDRAAWESLRAAALARVAADCDPDAFRATLRDALDSVCGAKVGRRATSSW